VASKWLGDGVRYVRALFSLSSKLAPCVVFVDEVDALLGKCLTCLTAKYSACVPLILSTSSAQAGMLGDIVCHAQQAIRCSA
jgi:AAA+ superfamily predicted ATPase